MDIENLINRMRGDDYPAFVNKGIALCEEVMKLIQEESPRIEIDALLRKDTIIGYKIRLDGKGYVAICLNRSGRWDLDIDPSDKEARPRLLTQEHTDQFKVLFEEFASKFREYGTINYIEEGFLGMSDPEASEAEESKFIEVCQKIINTLHNFDGPKYKNIHAIWHDKVLMITNELQRPVLIIVNRDGERLGSLSHTSKPMKVSSALEKTLEQVEELVKSKVDNVLTDEEKAKIDALEGLFRMPDELKRKIAEEIRKRMNGD